jgi:hypothetical protein
VPPDSKIDFLEFAKPVPARTAELHQVRAIAGESRLILNRIDTQQKLINAHKVGASSLTIEAIILEDVLRLGFQSQRKGLFAAYAKSGIRPDFFVPVGRSGILLEVERGKILANNLDLPDLWKCHICCEADYLFLLIPKYRPMNNGKKMPVFPRVSARLQTFFCAPNVINVEAAFLFGY